MLNEHQLTTLTIVFRHGADDASAALSKWLGKTASISVEQVEQVALSDAPNILGEQSGPVCSCAMAMKGRVTGQLVLMFDDASGLALADLLLGNTPGTAKSWGEMEQSAALETANIIGCAYLNALARFFPSSLHDGADMLPSPPRFTRDFAESLLEFILMNQAMASDQVFLTRTEFRIADQPVRWSLIFVPDADCLPALRDLLPV